MFNGIIKNIGIITDIKKKNNNFFLAINSKMKFKKDEIGSSVSCSGACLTIEKYNKNISYFYLSKETLNRTIFKSSKVGDIINLEKSLIYGDKVSGHFVQGHVDTTCYIKKITLLGKSWLVNFDLPKKYRKYVVEKGSIAIDGISLTIANLINGGFQISIIPHTLKLTNLVYLKKNKIVNIEFDVLGKYIKNFIN